MPTLSVKRDLLFAHIGKSFTDDAFDDLCFQFGIELDEVTSERQQVAREQGASAAAHLSDEVIYKIELPANRYDLLSVEGLSRAIKAYISDGRQEHIPRYTVKPATVDLHVKPSVATVRPFVVAAILRSISFDQDRYEGFIELQDKLHNGIGRKRTIVSMGTHDLDTIEGPFSYEALPPTDILFCPLNQSREMNGADLMQFYEADLKLRKFLPIIRDSPVYPVILDSRRRVCSLPPIINSDRSKIRLATKNVFIEVTGTDLGKLKAALNVIVTSFAQYCESIEAVRVVYGDDTAIATPDLSSRLELVSVDYINRSIGVKLAADEMLPLMSKMMLRGEKVSDLQMRVEVPCIRSDILHACDIMEDVAIGYGFNNIQVTLPKTLCTAAPLPINKLTDAVRLQVALCGYTEVLTLTLCSWKENFDYLLRPDPGNEAVVLSNPKTLEYEVVHTLLMPEMLKTLNANKRLPLPLKIFQIADVVLLDERTETGARNERHLSAAICGHGGSGFEHIHGLLDRVMQMLSVPTTSYHIASSALPMFFLGRQAEIHHNGRVVGSFGIVHPKVLANFEIPHVTSLLEMNIEPFL